MNFKKTIKYIGFYDSSEFIDEKRSISLAAVNKMDYISESIVKAGYNVQIISPSWTANKEGWYKKRTSNLSEGIELILGSTFGANIRIMKIMRIIWSWTWLFFYLVFNVKRGEKIIAYHSLMIDFPLYCAKRIKGFKLILEIEEEYCVVIKQPFFFEWLEKKMICYADYHILSTDLMKESYSHLNKDSIIIYGNYNVQEVTKGKENDKVSIVYAGIIDSVKSGAFNAIKVAEYLNSSYIIKVIGFGDKENIIKLKQEIERLNKITDCEIKYDGEKKGREYIEYLSECDIGLSTQTATGEYLRYSFPSKILSYMSVGLRVISSNIECVEKSKIGEIIYYYTVDAPESIAEAVKSINLDDTYDSFNYLNRLNKEFVGNIKDMLGV